MMILFSRKLTMPMNFNLSLFILFFLSSFIIYGSPVNVSQKSDGTGTELGLKDEAFVKHTQEDINVASVINMDAFANNKANDKNSKQSLPLSVEAKHNGGINSVPKKINKVIAMEGGGVIEEDSILDSPNRAGILAVESDNHPKGSKSKGTPVEVPSVVARKGVSELPMKANDSTVPNITDKPEISSTTEKQRKKPEVASDVRDPDDSEQYLGIKSSTTGQDYVIIGVVIVIGIWCSVFGALIFYRRAGEYWDRRHYRRMDFLVEGMYND